MVILLDKLLDEEQLLDTTTAKELRRLGLSREEIRELSEDSYQAHNSRNRGFLRALAVNFLQRNNSINGTHTGFVSAYLASEALGMDFPSILEITDGERKIVTEREVDGNVDLFIDVKDLHLCTRNQGQFTLTEAASLYARTHNPWAMEEALRLARETVERAAQRYYQKIGRRVDIDDLISDAYFGVKEALEKYEPDRGIKFETFSALRIRGAIADGLREIDPLPRLDRTRLDAMKKFAKEFEKENDNKTPSEEDYLEEWRKLEYPEDSFRQFYNTVLTLGRTVSLDRVTFQGEGKALRRKDGIPSSEPGPVRQAQSKELIEIFERDLLSIPPGYRDALRIFVLEGKTQKEVGEAVGLSESRVSQLTTLYLDSGAYFEKTRAYLEPEERREIRINLDE